MKDDGGGDSGGGIPGLPTLPDVGDACFSADSSVQVAGKGSVAMKDLTIGDLVMTDQQYQPVFGFAHLEPSRMAEFLSIEMASNGKPLEITSEHLVFMQEGNAVRADSVKVGDMLRGTEGAVTVTKIEKVFKQGLYAPMTPSGSVVVEGIVASNYVSLQHGQDQIVAKGGAIMSQHRGIHMAMSPLRMLCMGVSNSFCNTDNEQGMPAYVHRGIALARFAEEQNIVVQYLMALVAIVVFASSLFVENTFGAAMAPLALFMAATAYAVLKSTRTTVRVTKQKSV